jgi:lipopolysaccharide transport system ATP-binding protein
MKAVIKAEHVGKKYRVGATRVHHSNLGQMVISKFRALSDRRAAETARTNWALKDVGFEILSGEVVGIVGRNGAGKSTLLKILSRVTDPTTGRVELYGRIASMLEVGTGFHPELTGRENVFLNGAILGMKHVDIQRKFDRIVEFAEIGKYLDTPVKYYSSGMYVRLAFSVAAHLEPEILVIDEVLSVGDMAFQQKCLDKIRLLRKQTRAIILVSHSMILVKAICSRVLMVQNGVLTADGDPATVIPLYEKMMREGSESSAARDEVMEGMGHIQIKAVRLLDQQRQQKNEFQIGEKLTVVVEYDAVERCEDVIAYAAIRRPDDFICMGTSTQLENVKLPPLEGPGTIEIEVPELVLIPGDFIMDIVFYDKNYEYRMYFLGRKRVEFKVSSPQRSLNEMYGVFYQQLNWKIVEHKPGSSSDRALEK